MIIRRDNHYLDHLVIYQIIHIKQHKNKNQLYFDHQMIINIKHNKINIFKHLIKNIIIH